VRFDLDFNGNGLESCFDDDKFWPKFGGFLLKKLWYEISLISLKMLLPYNGPC
jgi:hypothetical protein